MMYALLLKSTVFSNMYALRCPPSCMLKLDDNTLFVIGGRQKSTRRYHPDRGGWVCEDGPTFNSTYFYDLNNMTYTEGPDLLTERRYHECSLFKHRGKDVVMVVGGLSMVGEGWNGGLGGYNGGHLHSVELLDLSNPTAWFPGKYLLSKLPQTNVSNFR